MCGREIQHVLKIRGILCQNNQAVTHSGCWHSRASSLTELSMQELPGESREVAVPVGDGAACNSGHSGTKVLMWVWTSAGEEDARMLSARADGEVSHEC